MNYNHHKGGDVITVEVLLHQVAPERPPLIQVFDYLPQDDLHPPHVGVQELHHLFALPQSVQHLNNS